MTSDTPLTASARAFVAQQLAALAPLPCRVEAMTAREYAIYHALIPAVAALETLARLGRRCPGRAGAVAGAGGHAVSRWVYETEEGDIFVMCDTCVLTTEGLTGEYSCPACGQWYLFDLADGTWGVTLLRDRELPQEGSR